MILLLRCSTVTSSVARLDPVRKGNKVSLILLQQLDNLGYKGEEVKVVPGYARNHLIPQRLAVYATQSNRDKYKIILPEAEAAVKIEERATNMLRARIAAVNLIFKRATKDGQNLYGGVTVSDVVEQIATTPLKNLKIKESNVKLPAYASSGEGEPALKTVGNHTIEVEANKAGYNKVWCNMNVVIMSA